MNNNLEPVTQQVFASDQNNAFAMPNERLFMRSVFSWMLLGVGLTSAIAVWFSSDQKIVDYFKTHPGVMIGLLVAQIGMVLGLTFGITRMSAAVARMMFVLYAGLTGAMFSSLLTYYTQADVALAFGGAAGVFGGMAAWGWFTKRSLDGYGPVLFGALIGLIVCNVLFIFFPGPTFNLILGIAGVIIFAGLTAWDMQKIKALGRQMPADGETAEKYAIFGALQLYLDFINLFLSLLRIFGGRD